MARGDPSEESLSRRLFGRSPPPLGTEGFTTVAELRAAGFPFHRETYAGSGFLFRGINGDLPTGAAQGAFGQNQGPGAPARLERELGVLWCSANPADAVGATGLWEEHREAGVAVFPAATFAAEQEAGRAGILAYAEGGMIFRYPFLAGPLPLDWVTRLLVPAHVAATLEMQLRGLPPGAPEEDRLMACRRRLSPLDLPSAGERRDAEGAVAAVLSRHAEPPATIAPLRA